MYLIVLSHKIQAISKLGGLMEGNIVFANKISKMAEIDGFVTVNAFDILNAEPDKSLDEYTPEEIEDYGIIEISVEHIVSMQKIIL